MTSERQASAIGGFAQIYGHTACGNHACSVIAHVNFRALMRAAGVPVQGRRRQSAPQGPVWQNVACRRPMVQRCWLLRLVGNVGAAPRRTLSGKILVRRVASWQWRTCCRLGLCWACSCSCCDSKPNTCCPCAGWTTPKPLPWSPAVRTLVQPAQPKFLAAEALERSSERRDGGVQS